jgi:hypothetical protein
MPKSELRGCIGFLIAAIISIIVFLWALRCFANLFGW